MFYPIDIEGMTKIERSTTMAGQWRCAKLSLGLMVAWSRWLTIILIDYKVFLKSFLLLPDIGYLWLCRVVLNDFPFFTIGDR